MNIQSRNKDLTEVFNQNWNASHNNNIHECINNQKSFWNKMNGKKDITPEKPKINYRQERLNNMNANIKSVRGVNNNF